MIYPEPTKKQKLEIYKMALVEIRAKRQEFLCNAIVQSYEKVMKTNVMRNKDKQLFDKYFPDFVQLKPVGRKFHEGWFGNMNETVSRRARIAIMKILIEDLK